MDARPAQRGPERGGPGRLAPKLKTRLSAERLDERWLLAAYSRARRLQQVAGGQATPLLVLDGAYADRSVRRRRGVLVLPARMLRSYLRRRPAVLEDSEVEVLRRRISAAA